jgi:hypothetical protein
LQNLHQDRNSSWLLKITYNFQWLRYSWMHNSLLYFSQKLLRYIFKNLNSEITMYTAKFTKVWFCVIAVFFMM